MKYINEEEKPYGLCSPEVQKQLDDCIGKGVIEYYSIGGCWAIRLYDENGLEGRVTYRAPLPVKTWRDALTERLKDYPDHLALVLERTSDENLDEEFTEWYEWEYSHYSFNWANTPEGHKFWFTFSSWLSNSICGEPPEIPKPTWRQKLTERLKDHPDHLALVIERTSDEKLEGEFTGWGNWSSLHHSFYWAETPEGHIFWREFKWWLIGDSNNPPEIPKPKKLQPSDVAGWWCNYYKNECHQVTSFDDGMINIDGTWIHLDDKGFRFSKDPKAPLDEWKTVEELEAKL